MTDPPAYIDCYPQIITMGAFSRPVVESFSVLVNRANQHISQNSNLVPFSCESCEQALSRYHADSGNDLGRAIYFEYGHATTTYVRFLRVWLRPREPNDPAPPNYIGCITVVPGKLSEGGFFQAPKYENYPTTIERINQMFQANPIPGKILNVETQDMKMSYSSGAGVDPDQCLWYESGKSLTMFLNCIRIFYIGGPPSNEVLSTVDFCPGIVGYKSFLGIQIPETQPLSAIMGTVNQWLQQHPECNFISLQSINFKLERHDFSQTGVDTHRTMFSVSGKFYTTFLRVIRLIFSVRGSAPAKPIRVLTYRTFVPCMLRTGGMHQPVFETMAETMQRAQAWLKLTGCRPVSAETVAVLYSPYGFEGANVALTSDATMMVESGSRGQFYVLCLRIYFDEPYVEPPAEMLPSVPVPFVDRPPLFCTAL